MNIYRESIEKLAKWRNVFAMWQLADRPSAAPAEERTIKDHREVTMLMRAELNALGRLLIEKGLMTSEDFERRIAEEAEHLSKAYESKFPGFAATEFGIVMTNPEAAETVATWRRK